MRRYGFQVIVTAPLRAGHCTMTGFSKKQLVDDLLALGVRPGSVLAMHSSFKSVGPVQGGPEGVLDALLETLGPEGTLMVPTHTYNYCFWAADPFNPKVTLSRVGLLTNLLWKRKGAFRSLHPTHSVAAIGARAEELTEHHLRSTPLGVGSPWDRLRRAGGDVLMLGTSLDTCTILHLAECMAPALYLPITFLPGESLMSAHYVNKDNIRCYTRLGEIPGCSINFPAAMPSLDRAGHLKRGKVGQAETMLMPGDAGVQEVIERIREQPDLLLCRRPECQICPARRRFIQPNH